LFRIILPFSPYSIQKIYGAAEKREIIKPIINSNTVVGAPLVITLCSSVQGSLSPFMVSHTFRNKSYPGAVPAGFKN
jgi:hypothetical protein